MCWRVLVANGVLAIVMTLAHTTAHAQNPEIKAGARAAAEQGRHAYEGGSYQEAIDFFERAQQLVSAPTHTLYLARAHEKLGELVAARELYLELDRLEFGPRAPRAFRRAQKEARTELKALEPRLAYLTVHVEGPGAANAVVKMNDEQVPTPLVGLTRPVDPGDYALQATSGKMKSEVLQVWLDEGARDTVTLTLVAPKPAVPSQPAPPIGAPRSPAKQPAPPPTTNWLRIPAYVAFGVAAFGMGAGAYFQVNKNDKTAEADKLFKACNQTGCTDGEQKRIANLDDEASAAGTKSNTGYAVGGACVGLGIALLVINASTGNDETSAGWQPWVGVGSAGLSGRF